MSPDESNHATTIAEDDDLRSKFIFNLIQQMDALPGSHSLGASRIPKVIMQFWHDLGDLPNDVGSCIKSWSVFRTKGFDHICFDDVEACEFISRELGPPYVQAFELCHHPAMRCDYFRLCYLITHGGFYVDADEEYQGANLDWLFYDDRLKIQPLCFDIEHGKMVCAAEFVSEKAQSSNCIYYLNNNPIASPASHPIIRLALERSTDILLNLPRPHDIQSTTGPGNLTASVVRHCIESNHARDLLLLSNWDSISISKWPLSYRNDECVSP